MESEEVDFGPSGNTAASSCPQEHQAEYGLTLDQQISQPLWK